MASKFRNSRLFKAISISIAINGLMILLGTIGGLVKPLSGLGKFSDWVAAPPGFLIGWLIRPTVHSATSFAIAGFEGLLVSIVFYTILAWIVLRFLTNRRSSRSDSNQS
jgi:hypothetical protein